MDSGHETMTIAIRTETRSGNIDILMRMASGIASLRSQCGTA
jgi:hypothetical protein